MATRCLLIVAHSRSVPSIVIIAGLHWCKSPASVAFSPRYVGCCGTIKRTNMCSDSTDSASTIRPQSSPDTFQLWIRPILEAKTGNEVNCGLTSAIRTLPLVVTACANQRAGRGIRRELQVHTVKDGPATSMPIAKPASGIPSTRDLS